MLLKHEVLDNAHDRRDQSSPVEQREQIPVIVTVSEEGEEGLLLQVEDGETYHFLPLDIPEATIFISVNSEGLGNVAYAEGETEPETDVPFQSAQINLAEPAAYTFVAWPKTGNLFVKWMKDGEDFSTDPKITLELDQSTDLVAVFEEDPDWQNPVMNFVGEYQCDRAHALVECLGYDEAIITIEWGSSAWELARCLFVLFLLQRLIRLLIQFDQSVSQPGCRAAGSRRGKQQKTAALFSLVFIRQF